MAKLVKIPFQPLGKTVEVDLDQMPYKDHGEPGAFLDVALNHGIHLEHACGGNCPRPPPPPPPRPPGGDPPPPPPGGVGKRGEGAPPGGGGGGGPPPSPSFPTT